MAKDPNKKKKDKPAESASTTSGGNDYGLDGPSAGGAFTPEDQEGSLLLISPLSLEEGIKTTFGEKSAIKADVVVLNRDDPSQSEEIAGALLFPAALQGQLQKSLARRTRVVGTLFKDVNAQKPGQKPPWKLSAPTDADMTVAKRYLDSLNPLR